MDLNVEPIWMEFVPLRNYATLSIRVVWASGDLCPDRRGQISAPDFKGS